MLSSYTLPRQIRSSSPIKPLYCSESVWSCLTVSADRQLSEVKHTHLSLHPSMIDTDHISAQWKLNWTEMKQIDLKWRSRDLQVNPTHPLKRGERVNSFEDIYPLNSYSWSQWDEESIPTCTGCTKVWEMAHWDNYNNVFFHWSTNNVKSF